MTGFLNFNGVFSAFPAASLRPSPGVRWTPQSLGRAALNALDYWERVSDAKRIKIPSGVSMIDYSVKRELDAARRLRLTARDLAADPKKGAKRWMIHDAALQDFFAYKGKTSPAEVALWKAWTHIGEGVARALGGRPSGH
jgi:hypothetical protein